MSRQMGSSLHAFPSIHAAMSAPDLRQVRNFTTLIRYLEDELGWPLDGYEMDDLTFDYEPSDLGLKEEEAAKVKFIKQLRPVTSSQPWGIFFIEFDKKQLPVVVLRRILSHLVLKKRASANAADAKRWNAQDLLFVSAFGPEDADGREIGFAHFHEESGDLPSLRVLGWDGDNTALTLQRVASTLKERLRWTEKGETVDAWRQRWSGAFKHRPGHIIKTSDLLAEALAALAKRIRDAARTLIEHETEHGPLRKLHRAFQTNLIHDLDEDGFADTYAQTITYGLLTAAINRTDMTGGRHGTFVKADDVALAIKPTSPFLKEMLETFLKVGGRKGHMDFDELGVQDVVELLRSDVTDIPAILADFGNKTRGEDPVIHFYEHFLSAYNKKLKVQRGVFYTPQAVVGYIVRSVHELLQTEFGLEDGLASTITWGEMIQKNPSLQLPLKVEGNPAQGTISESEPFVQILDPATGTATFLVETIEVIHRTLKAKWQSQRLSAAQQRDAWNDYVPNHLLPRLHGYELMMAPYAIAHMKIGLKLTELGYNFASDARAQIYLTNALEPWVQQLPLIGFDALAHEAAAVNEIKRHKRFTVVIGNPPYARISSNMGAWISELIEDFKYVDGVHFAEVKHWLHDDYVKFLRLAYSKLTTAGCGVLGMITNRGYLSGPTFRGMRNFIWQKSSALQLLDLHGGAIQEECKPPLNVVDENVFEIKQGVAIFISTITGNSSSASARTYGQLWGDRKSKYDQLAKGSALSENGTELAAISPRYDFIPSSNVDLDREYSGFIAVNKLFPTGSTGIQTSRDGYVVSFEKGELEERFDEFCDAKHTDGFFRSSYGLEDGRNWDLSDARRKLRAERDWKAMIVKCQFRPLDLRWMLYHASVINWPRPEVMPHMLRHNIGLIVPRNYQGGQFDAALVSRFITEVKTGESTRGSYCYPLYLYGRDALFSSKTSAPQPNIDEALLVGLAKRLKLTFISNGLGDLDSTFGPEDVLNYVYASLYSTSYRERYSSLIKNEFPRLPLTENLELFRALARLGGELTALHLLESPKLAQHITEFIGTSKEVTKVGYSGGTVWINASGTKGKTTAGTSGFRGVPEAVWNFHIGGYQVCEKWLKDRKGRSLTDEDIAHYHKIVIALTETIRLMAEIDEVIAQHGGWPLK